MHLQVLNGKKQFVLNKEQRYLLDSSHLQMYKISIEFCMSMYIYISAGLNQQRSQLGTKAGPLGCEKSRAAPWLRKNSQRAFSIQQLDPAKTEWKNRLREMGD